MNRFIIIMGFLFLLLSLLIRLNIAPVLLYLFYSLILRRHLPVEQWSDATAYDDECVRWWWYDDEREGVRKCWLVCDNRRKVSSSKKVTGKVTQFPEMPDGWNFPYAITHLPATFARLPAYYPTTISFIVIGHSDQVGLFVIIASK